MQGLKYRVKIVDHIKNNLLECIGYLNKWGSLYTVLMYYTLFY